jgi:ABC-type enterochelin transport system substrate-binding protein
MLMVLHRKTILFLLFSCFFILSACSNVSKATNEKADKKDSTNLAESIKTEDLQAKLEKTTG